MDMYTLPASIQNTAGLMLRMTVTTEQLQVEELDLQKNMILKTAAWNGDAEPVLTAKV